MRALVSSGQVWSTAYTLLRRTKSGGGRSEHNLAAAAPRLAGLSFPNSETPSNLRENPDYCP